jgi:hypothetical protein
MLVREGRSSGFSFVERRLRSDILSCDEGGGDERLIGSVRRLPARSKVEIIFVRRMLSGSFRLSIGTSRSGKGRRFR